MQLVHLAARRRCPSPAPEALAGLVLPFLFLLGGCGEADSSARDVERSDSAGIEVVMNRGGDVPLDWSFEPVVRLGGTDDGPEAFGSVQVDTDRAGNLHVLDRTRHQVIVFSPEGEHLRTVGARGGGPGEMEFPLAFSVSGEGVVHVFDAPKTGLLRWGPDGSLLPLYRVEVPFFGGALMASRTGFVLPVNQAAAAASTTTQKVIYTPWEGEAVVLAETETEVHGPVVYPGCPVQISAQARLLQPRATWGGQGNVVAVNRQPEYEVSIHREGVVRTIVRRDVRLRRATVEDARYELPDPFVIRYGSGECRISVEDAVEALGIAETVPAIRQVAVAPDGTLWLSRTGTNAPRRLIDIIAPDGAYLGTLDTEMPFPAAFTPEGDPVVVERDDFDLQYVMVYRVTRA